MRLFLLLILFPLHLFAEWESLFSNDEDPALFHHVNVISGQLTLAIEDAKLQGAYPFSLIRTYCSNAGFQPDNLNVQKLKRDIYSQEGWQFLPHTKLLVHFKPDDYNFKEMTFHVPEPNGATVSYTYSHRKNIGKHEYHYY